MSVFPPIPTISFCACRLTDEFEISDDEEDILLIGLYGRQKWLRGIVGGIIDKLTLNDRLYASSNSLRRQSKHLMDACDSFVAAEIKGINEEEKRLGMEIMERLIVYYVSVKMNANVVFEDLD